MLGSFCNAGIDKIHSFFFPWKFYSIYFIYYVYGATFYFL